MLLPELHTMAGIRSILFCIALILAVVTCSARAQLSCDQPLATPLGSSQTATLLSFPDFEAEFPCDGTTRLWHAVYHHFTAPEDGWYSMHVLPPLDAPWRPRIATLAECGTTAGATFGATQDGYPYCQSPASTLRPYASTTVHLTAGQSRVVVVGGQSVNDGGSAELRITRIGSTLMDGAQELQLGDNLYAVAPIEPDLPYAGACIGWSNSGMGGASRFRFTPSKPGSYRFSFCASNRVSVAISDSPNLQYATLVTAYGGCAGEGGRITAPLTPGVTYYIVAGYPYGNLDGCRTLNARVEYIDPCPADLDGNDLVDGSDLALVLAGWGTPSGDITGDGTTNGTDLAIMIGMWGPCGE